MVLATQAISIAEPSDLITAACEIKVSARRGLTLVKMHGDYSTVTKLLTLVARGYINGKFEKVKDHLRKINPIDTTGAQESKAQSHQPPQPSSPTPSGVADKAQGSLQRSSLAAPAQLPIQGLLIRNHKHDRVHSMAFVPCDSAIVADNACIWWCAGQSLEFFSGVSQSTTNFTVPKPSMVVTYITFDADENMWTGHMRGLIRVRKQDTWVFAEQVRANIASNMAFKF